MRAVKIDPHSKTSCLAVRGNLVPVIHDRAQTEDKAMVEVFMRRIKRAHGYQKKISQRPLKHELVAGVKRLLNRDCRGLREDDVHLLQDFLVVDERDFLVRQGQFADEVAAERLFGLDDPQIARHEQETVDRRRIVADLRIDHAGVDVGCDGFPLNQQVQLVVHAVVRGRQNLADHGIAAGRLPVGARLAFVAEVVDDLYVKSQKHLRISKQY